MFFFFKQKTAYEFRISDWSSDVCSSEIKMMLTAFSNMETVHIAAYSHLLDTIGMPESEYSMFLQYKEMKDKHDYLATFGVDSDEDIAKTLAMFGGFTEGLQLFASLDRKSTRLNSSH